jgi:hypothetical protein
MTGLTWLSRSGTLICRDCLTLLAGLGVFSLIATPFIVLMLLLSGFPVRDWLLP